MAKRRARRKSLKGAIKRPGALTARAKRGKKRSVRGQAQYDKKHGTPLQKKQANYYLNVLAPANRRRRKK